MIPLTFCLENAEELIPDWRRKILSGEARKFADNGFSPRTRFKVRGPTYFDVVLAEHERIVWMEAYFKRRARIGRMKAKALTTLGERGESEWK